MDTGQIRTHEHEPRQLGTAQLEQQMRETRARIDRKLDALTARTTRVRERVREQTPWAILALVGGSAVAMQFARWMRRRRHRRAARH